METKLSKVIAAARDGRWTDALAIAARFAELGDHEAAIRRGHEASGNARFYAQIGRDPEEAIKAGIAALCERYMLNPKTGEPIMTNFTGTQIAQLTAILTGGGYKRASSKEAAIRRLTAVAEERLGKVAGSHAAKKAIDFEHYETAADYLRGLLSPSPTDGPAKKKTTPAGAAAKASEKSAPKPAAAEADGPRPGSKSRITFDLMRRPDGVTQKESAEAGGMNENLNDVVARFAERYGFAVTRKQDGRSVRYGLAEQQ